MTSQVESVFMLLCRRGEAIRPFVDIIVAWNRELLLSGVFGA